MKDNCVGCSCQIISLKGNRIDHVKHEQFLHWPINYNWKIGVYNTRNDLVKARQFSDCGTNKILTYIPNLQFKGRKPNQHFLFALFEGYNTNPTHLLSHNNTNKWTTHVHSTWLHEFRDIHFVSYWYLYCDFNHIMV